MVIYLRPTLADDLLKALPSRTAAEALVEALEARTLLISPADVCLTTPVTSTGGRGIVYRAT